MSNSYNWSHRKLTFEQVQQIRQEYAQGRTTQAKLAEKYNVRTSLIERILHNRGYNKPTPEEKMGPKLA